MEELDLLKKHWKKEDDLPKISKDEIGVIIHKKSSSVVKWIFIISVIELLLGFVLLFFMNSDDKSMVLLMEKNSFLKFIDKFSYVLYVVVIYFIYRFYTMYRKISVGDNTTKLMENIIQTRKVVRHYMLFNVITFFLMCISVSWIVIQDRIYNEGFSQHHLSSIQFVILYAVMFFVIAVMTVIFWLIYKLIYGYFLRKLQKNYNELKNNEA
ncbi:hypothetical protein EG240_12485 [Paenimyroides tangerinum]|uniref:Uncharacterized protein n=1 Tax=Paenimyroides tangerinum TaxID=2488728 RepID=A0A3P3W275_9FLAO|nr:hypothetical protein [Paenimyroides tangerinum]RRJ89181.1 hypothetical protein EG240_12485 [Paenimyroides tangerinum]